MASRASWPDGSSLRLSGAHGAGTVLVLISLVLSVLSGCSNERHSEVIIVINSESPVSVAIGSYYAQARDVPDENVVALAIPLSDPTLADGSHETISAEQYQTLIRQPLEAWIDEREMRDSIEIIVTTKGVPLRVNGATGTLSDWLRVTSQAAVDAELSLLFSEAAGSAGIRESINPFFDSKTSFQTFRDDHPDEPLRYMVARLTGYGNELEPGTQLPVDIKQLIDAATAVLDENVSPHWVVDEDPTRGPGLGIANKYWLALTADILRHMGAEVLHDQSKTFTSGAEEIAGYTSWGSNDGNDAGKPYYGEIKGKHYPGSFAPRSIANDLVSTSARSFTHPPKYGQSLVADLVHLGIAGAAGHVYEPALSGVPRPQIFLPSYAEGARAVEAFYRSVPYLSWMNIYVGDPLMVRAKPLENPQGDRDQDGIPDINDNCTFVPNVDQRDSNHDGFGNVCDADVDGDGIVTSSWGGVYPLSQRGDVEWIAMSSQNGPHDPNFDLDGDGDVDDDDLSIAHMSLFMPPGPSGIARSAPRD
ncbi:MAG: hypothetical protein ACI9QQ_001886 [Myxococcota bacterium]|jgi:uncharacterized protein (TIGR03790 family)